MGASVIRNDDKFGMYVIANGSICVPQPNRPTTYEVGDKVRGYARAGTPLIPIRMTTLHHAEPYEETWNQIGSADEYRTMQDGLLAKHIDQAEYDEWMTAFFTGKHKLLDAGEAREFYHWRSAMLAKARGVKG